VYIFENLSGTVVKGGKHCFPSGDIPSSLSLLKIQTHEIILLPWKINAGKTCLPLANLGLTYRVKNSHDRKNSAVDFLSPDF
jgi:hypothetical protein